MARERKVDAALLLSSPHKTSSCSGTISSVAHRPKHSPKYYLSMSQRAKTSQSLTRVKSTGPDRRVRQAAIQRRVVGVPREEEREVWWAHQDLNLEPKRYEHSALTD
jgi:hypothetical protein